MKENNQLSRIIVCSTSGHDKGEYYLVSGWEEDSGTVKLYNGRNRTLSSPKKKNRKHLQIIRHLDDHLIDQIEHISRDEDIRRVLTAYRKSQSEV